MRMWLFSTACESDLLDRNVRQKEKTELSTYLRELSIHWRIQVANHHFLKERRFILLMCNKRHLQSRVVSVLKQQTQKWKKFYKSRMFKYKGKIHVFSLTSSEVLEFQQEKRDLCAQRFLFIQACGQACFQRVEY